MEELTAYEWLQDYLKDGPRDLDSVRGCYRAAGFTRGQIKDAKRALHVITTSNGSKDHPATVWYWSMP